MQAHGFPLWEQNVASVRLFSPGVLGGNNSIVHVYSTNAVSWIISRLCVHGGAVDVVSGYCDIAVRAWCLPVFR